MSVPGRRDRVALAMRHACRPTRLFAGPHADRPAARRLRPAGQTGCGAHAVVNVALEVDRRAAHAQTGRLNGSRSPARIRLLASRRWMPPTGSVALAPSVRARTPTRTRATARGAAGASSSWSLRDGALASTNRQDAPLELAAEDKWSLSTRGARATLR